MPAARYHLVRVLGDHHRGERHRQIALQVRQHQLVVVAGRQQVVRRWREADRSDIGRVWLEALNRPVTPDIVQYTRAILVT